MPTRAIMLLLKAHKRNVGVFGRRIALFPSDAMRGSRMLMPNNSMQRTALRAAADAERYRAGESSAYLAGWKSPSGKG